MIKSPYKVLLFLISLPLITSCGIFGSDSQFNCNDLVLTDYVGLELGKEGEPSEQWKIMNLNSKDNEPDSVDLSVSSAYPNPVNRNKYSTIRFSIHKEMNVNIQLTHAKKDFNRNILNERLSVGHHTRNIKFEPDGCYRVDFHFDGSKKSNAYGLVLVE